MTAIKVQGVQVPAAATPGIATAAAPPADATTTPAPTIRYEPIEIERLRVGYERYETVRLMRPGDFLNAYTLNINTGKPFDEIVDELRPFLRA